MSIQKFSGLDAPSVGVEQLKPWTEEEIEAAAVKDSETPETASYDGDLGRMVATAIPKNLDLDQLADTLHGMAGRIRALAKSRVVQESVGVAWCMRMGSFSSAGFHPKSWTAKSVGFSPAVLKPEPGPEKTAPPSDDAWRGAWWLQFVYKGKHPDVPVMAYPTVTGAIGDDEGKCGRADSQVKELADVVR